MIDTHCHLTDPRLHRQLDFVLARAAAAGVPRLVTISTSVADSRACVAVCRGRPNVRCAVGVHPTYVAGVADDELPLLRDIQADPAVVAIGEIGLDYYHGTEHKRRQFDFFNAQLQLATDANRPVVIHCREAVDDCLAVMAAFPAVRAVVHCFTGTAAEARRVLDAGYLIGFTGIVTYKQNDALREVVRLVPDDRLLVETDAPYLSPEPVRKQKTCEPAFTMHTAARVAEVRGTTVERIDEVTTRNADALFGTW